MFGDEYTSTLIVEIAGSPLAAGLAQRMVRAHVDDSSALPDLFSLTFADEGGTLLQEAGISVGVAIRLLVQQNGPSGPIALLSGEVTALEREASAAGMHTTVRGYDHSHRLFRGRRVVAYLDSTVGDIASAVATRAGLKPGDISSTGPVLRHVSQDGVNDWQFLSRLAEQTGSIVTVLDGALNFSAPTAAATAPDGAAGSKENAAVLERGVNVLSMRATVTSASQVPEVEVRGWSVDDKREIVAVAPAATKSAALTDAKPADLAKKFKSPRFVEPDVALEQPSQYDTVAASISSQLAGAFAELDGSVRGNPRLKAGAAVSLTGFGSPFDGRYTVSHSRHEFSAELGYLTFITVSSTSDRSLYGVAAGGSGKAAAGALPGVVSGIVTATQDPNKAGRVKVKFPTLDGSYESWWVRCVQMGGGPGRGLVVLPEVGDEVLVAFGHGSLEAPYVLGGLFNGKDRPDKPWDEHLDSTDGSVVRRSFTSRTGMSLEFLESPKGESIVVSTNSGKQRITLTQSSAAAIEIVAEGPVSINAQKDVTVSTGTGAISLKGKSVSVEATAGLELTGATVTISGKTSAKLGAPSVKVAADATAELSAGGITTVRGATVKIN